MIHHYHRRPDYEFLDSNDTSALDSRVTITLLNERQAKQVLVHRMGNGSGYTATLPLKLELDFGSCVEYPPDCRSLRAEGSYFWCVGLEPR